MSPLPRHPLDALLIPFFAISVIYGALVSLPEGLGVPVAPDSPWPPLRALHVGLAGRRRWTRPLGLVYAGAGVTNIAPALLGWRLWPRPETAQ